jgi:hypothetical protein
VTRTAYAELSFYHRTKHGSFVTQKACTCRAAVLTTVITGMHCTMQNRQTWRMSLPLHNSAATVCSSYCTRWHCANSAAGNAYGCARMTVSVIKHVTLSSVITQCCYLQQARVLRLYECISENDSPDARITTTQWSWTLRIQVLWGMALCRVVNQHERFQRAGCFHLHCGPRSSGMWCLVAK